MLAWVEKPADLELGWDRQWTCWNAQRRFVIDVRNDVVNGDTIRISAFDITNFCRQNYLYLYGVAGGEPRLVEISDPSAKSLLGEVLAGIEGLPDAKVAEVVKILLANWENIPTDA